MLRHLKMELKRREELADSSASSCGSTSIVADDSIKMSGKHTGKSNTPDQAKKSLDKLQVLQKQQVVTPTATGKRVRGRRSSKPMMEKKRRARINECLDILKSYVLGDSSNLVHLGIDTTATENRDEETLARTILKSSGLINRHRGRKNPNKLEKADILELTVDYVRRLHEQRYEWINQRQVHHQTEQPSTTSSFGPLRINLAAIDKTHMQLQTTPPSPPPSSSSNSSSPKPLLTISSNIQQQQQSPVPVTSSCSDVLDLSDCNRRRADQQSFNTTVRTSADDGLMFCEAISGCWRSALTYN